MKDPNWPLRKIYHTALTGITYNSATVKNYYPNAPNDITDKYYIVFLVINGLDVSPKSKFANEISMQLTIHTYETKDNNGRAADDIAQQIFDALYPDSLARPDMTADGLQIVTTKLTGNNPLPYSILNSRSYFDRVLTFTHRISQQ